MVDQPVEVHGLEPMAREIRKEYDGLRLCTTLTISCKGKERVAGLVGDLAVTQLNVHARNLSEFFTGPYENSRPDDVFAYHYAPLWDGERHGADVRLLRLSLLPGVNKRTAHISARRVRVDAGNDAVQIAEIYWSLAWTMQRFLDMLEPERRRWFERDGELPDTGLSALTFSASS